MNFERGKDPKESLSIGGYGFDTLRRGTIIEVIKSFGVEKGKLLDSSMFVHTQFHRGSYMIVRDILEVAEFKRRGKFISFIKHPPGKLEWVEQDRGILERREAFPGWRTTGHIGFITKKQFDNRMKVIKPGF